MRPIAAIAAGTMLLACSLAGAVGVSAGGGPGVGGCALFPTFAGPPGAASAADQTAWNQDVSATAKHPRSARHMKRIRRLGGNRRLHPDFGGGGAYGIPYRVVGAAEPRVGVRIGAGGWPGESDFGIGTTGPPDAPIPLDTAIEGGGDRHVLVVQSGACELFEMYRAFPGSGDWEADSTAHWDLSSPARHPEGWTSADAAGLPILPGLVRYEEVAAGAVEHAIRATFSRTRRAHIHPATHHASSRCGRWLPPMGLRLRLKRGYYDRHIQDFGPASQARPIFEALYRYGLLVADNGSNWFFTGAADPRWDDDDVGDLKDVPGKAFVVVEAQAPATTPC